MYHARISKPHPELTKQLVEEQITRDLQDADRLINSLLCASCEEFDDRYMALRMRFGANFSQSVTFERDDLWRLKTEAAQWIAQLEGYLKSLEGRSIGGRPDMETTTFWMVEKAFLKADSELAMYELLSGTFEHHFTDVFDRKAICLPTFRADVAEWWQAFKPRATKAMLGLE